MAILDKLQSTFTAFIANKRDVPSLAPAFFMPDMLSTIAVPNFSPVEERCPFDTFWAIYESANPPSKTITNIVLVRGRVVTLYAIVHATTNKLRCLCAFDLDNPADYSLSLATHSRAVRETIPEIRMILDRINNHEREVAAPPMLKRLNEARAKAGVKKLAPYIILKPTRVAIPTIPTGIGSPKNPHERRGHYRTLARTGARVWIKPCSIHGGSKVARDYRFSA